MDGYVQEEKVMLSPAGVPVATSRLDRSTTSAITSLADVEQFCREHNIPYALDFRKDVLPTAALREVFERTYAVQYLPPTTLRERGARTIMAFETKNPNNNPTLHGEVTATISGFIGEQLQPGVDVIYIKSDVNPSYRAVHQREVKASLEKLLEEQGVPVVLSCVAWDDSFLMFDHSERGQFEHFWRVTAFVVDSIGNEGIYGTDGKLPAPRQKHRASNHAPPLAVTVGAVEIQSGKKVIPGYSAATGPTFLAPVANHAKIMWKPDKEPEAITGTSAACPYVGGVLAALNERYGAYLTREQILYALIATCDPIRDVTAFAPQSPKDYQIEYKKNGAGLLFNASVGGFGLINPHKADHILGHMVALTQRDPDSITAPTEERLLATSKPIVPEDGKYTYYVKSLPGLALKTTLEVEFKDIHGFIKITSPSGTELPMIMSQLPVYNFDHLPKGKSYYAISTSHGWAGEEMAGTWKITSTAPISRLRLNSHHFLENDIVGKLDIDALLKIPMPDLSAAVPITSLRPTMPIRNKAHLELVPEPMQVAV